MRKRTRFAEPCVPKKNRQNPLFIGILAIFNKWSWWRDLNPWPLPYQHTNLCSKLVPTPQNRP